MWIILGKNRCLVNKIKKQVSRFYKYYDWYTHPNDLSCERDPKVLSELDLLQQKINKLNQAVYFSKSELILSLENAASNPNYFLKEFFIRGQCKENRIKLNKGKLIPVMSSLNNELDGGTEFVSNEKKFNTISSIMKKNNRSIGIAFVLTP